jgi:hypothetical protein
MTNTIDIKMAIIPYASGNRIRVRTKLLPNRMTACPAKENAVANNSLRNRRESSLGKLAQPRRVGRWGIVGKIASLRQRPAGAGHAPGLRSTGTGSDRGDVLAPSHGARDENLDALRSESRSARTRQTLMRSGL